MAGSRIAIVGSGTVGQATGRSFAHMGHDVCFIDVDAKKLRSLRQEGFEVSRPEEFGKHAPFEAFFVSVPTPFARSGVDTSFVETAAQMLGEGPLQREQKFHVVVFKSTVPPGTTRGVLIPLLEAASGKRAGEDFGVAFEPEFLREKSALQDALAPRIIVYGVTDDRTDEALRRMRESFHTPTVRLSLEEAEMQKYAHNLFNAVKISYFNEMRSVCKGLGIDADKIFSLVMTSAEGAWNTQYGIRDYGPFDGKCLPKDTAGFLSWAENTLGSELPLLKATIAVNEGIIRQQQKWYARVADSPRKAQIRVKQKNI